MSKLTFLETKKEVERLLKRTTVNDAKKYIKKSYKNDVLQLWCLNKPRQFIDKVFFSALYKDVKNCSYLHMQNTVKNWGMEVSDKTIQSNQHRLRTSLSVWGKNKIKTGEYSDWHSAARNNRFPKSVKDVNLFWDSADFCLEKKKGVGRKSKDFSHKCNGPGIRFMCICDSQTKIRYLDGPYSPKLYDGDWVTAKTRMLKHKFSEGVICGDGHFITARKKNLSIKGFPKCYAPSPNSKKKTEDGTIVSKLTNEQTLHNSDISKIRGRVEMPFADFGKLFSSLNKTLGKFRETPEEMGKIICIAGFHNMNCK